METGAAQGDGWLDPSLSWRPARGVPAAIAGCRRSPATRACLSAAVATAVYTAWIPAAVAGESVSPLPILLWITAPVLVAVASTIAAYAASVASRRLRRLLKTQAASLRRRLVGARPRRPLPPRAARR